jgi:hypothetical protein
MNSRFTSNRVLIIFSILVFLLLTAIRCSSDPTYHHADFHVQGFLDSNINGIWDDGEPEFTGFTFETRMTAEDGADPPSETISLIVTAGGVDFSFDVYKDAKDEIKVDYSFRVLNLPEGYVAGSFREELISHSSYDQKVPWTDWCEEHSNDPDCPDKYYDHNYYDDYVFEINVPIQGEVFPTSTPTPTFTPTFTPTNTSTNTPIPTSTYTPTPTITASLTGYGSYGGGVDFVKFKLSYAPASGTFSANVGGNIYTCSSSSSAPTVLTCQGPAFPSGKYVDVFLYFNGGEVYSGQIFRAVPDKPTKTPEEPQ